MPESIHLGSLHAGLQKLSRRTAETGNEIGRVGFVDLQTEELLLGGARDGASDHCCFSLFNPDPARETWRIVEVLLAHTHPVRNGALRDQHFSRKDFETFLLNPALQMTLTITGGYYLGLLKTSQSAREPPRKELNRILSVAEQSLNRNSSLLSRFEFTLQLANTFRLAVCQAKQSGSPLLHLVDASGLAPLK